MRLLFGLLVITLLMAAATFWSAQHPGQISIIWLGYTITSNASVFVMLLLVASLAIALLALFISRVWRIRSWWRGRRNGQRQGKAWQAMEQFMLANITGNASAAKLHASQWRRQKLSAAYPLIDQVMALETARLDGDLLKAEALLLQMLQTPKTREAALTVLASYQGAPRLQSHIMVAVEDLLKPLQSNFSTAPSTSQLEHALSALRQSHAWHAGKELLQQTLSNRPLLARLTQQNATPLLQSAVLFFTTADANTQPSDAKRDELLSALRAQPHWLPSALTYISLCHMPEQLALADTVMLAVWKETPHPALVQAYAKRSGLLPKQQWKRIQQLTRLQPADGEAHLAAAAMAAQAQRFSAVQFHLSSAIGHVPAAQVDAVLKELRYTILNASESNQVDIPALQQQLQSAPEPFSPRWICQQCDHEDVRWHPACPSCNGTDSLQWVTPKTPSTIPMMKLA